MAKYRMVSISVFFDGTVFEKSDNPIFDSKKRPGMASAYHKAMEDGFLELIPETEIPAPAAKIEPAEPVAQPKKGK